jgi:protein TonB
MPAEPAAPVAIEEEPESPQPTRELIKEDVPQKKEMTKPVDVPVSHDHKDDVDETAHVIKIAEQQTPAVLDENEIVHDVVEQMPSFPGGDAALTQYLSSNVKYPAVAVENGIQGRVVCKFVVERDGSITDVRVVKSVDPSLDKEAVRVIRAMPRWFPGRQNGAAVRVNYTVPVRFSLQ